VPHAPLAPIAAHQLLIFLLQVGILLGLALLLSRVAMRFGLPAVVGELSVGVLLGPSLLGQVAPDFSGWLLPADSDQIHLLDAVGQLGALLLVAMTGVHLDMGLVRRRFGTAIGVSTAGLLIPLGLGIGVGLLLPMSFLGTGVDRPVFALFLGVAMCVSALPVIAKTLSDLRMLHRNVGQLTLIAGTIDDAFGWVMLSVVAAMATTGLRFADVGQSLLYLAAIIAFAATIGRPIVRTAYRYTERSSTPGSTVALTVILVFLGAAATQALKFEAVFGAFVVGILIGTFSGVQPARLAPLWQTTMSVLAPLFFAIAGLRMDLTALGHPDVLLVAVIVLSIAIIGKFAGAYVGARLARLNRWEAIALGAGMNARGVIEVIVAMVGLRLGVLNTETYTIIVLVAIVTSVMAPPILKWSTRRIEITAEERARQAAQDAYIDIPAGRQATISQEEHTTSPRS
jgi:Kef-type K+ transport system membrane component KefB